MPRAKPLGGIRGGLCFFWFNRLRTERMIQGIVGYAFRERIGERGRGRGAREEFGGI